MSGVSTGKMDAFNELHKVALEERRTKQIAIWTPDALDALGKEMIEFVKLPGVWHLSAFAAEKGRSGEWLLELSKKYEIFKDYYKCAKEVLGRKITNHTFEGGKSNAFIVETLTPMYLSDIDKYQVAKLRKKARIEMEMKKMLETKQDGGNELVDALRKYLELSKEISDHAAKKAQDAAE